MVTKKTKKKAPGWYVRIVHSSTKEVAREMGPISSERQAERIERGALINLDHDNYHTEISEVKS